MRILNKKVLTLTLSSLVLTTSITPIFAEEEYRIEFKNNKAHYIELCNSDLKDNEETQKVCLDFNKYLKSENEKVQDRIKELQIKSDELAANIEEYLPLVREYDGQILSIDSDISRLDELMKKLEEPLEEKTKQILSISNEIELIKERQKQRVDKMFSMVNTEKIYKNAVGEKDSLVKMALQNYMSTLDTTKNENEDIKAKEVKIDKISKTRETQSLELDNLQAVKDQLSFDRQAVGKLKEGVNKIIIEYKRQQAELDSKKTGFIADLDEAKAIINNISKNITSIISSSEFIYPLKNFEVSAGAWNYPEGFGGGIHLGLDLATSKGDELLAPANGVVVYSSDSCADNGYLGNSCGAPGVMDGGNQVHMVVVVNDELYGISYFHLESGSVIAPGTKINQGDVVGKVGLSGNTTGAHVHIETYKLNNYSSITEMMDEWDMDLSYGNGYGTTGYANRCEVKGGNCRLKPNDVFKLSVGQNINLD